MPSSTVLKFTLEIGGVADEFRVLEFDLAESISECFRLHIEAGYSGTPKKYADLIGKDATLTVTGEDFAITHHGVVTEFNQYPDATQSFGHENALYDIVIEPRFKLLEYTTQSRIFQDFSIPDIVKKVLEGGKLLAGTHYRLELSGSYPKRRYTVQYSETDLNFVQRLLEEEGIFYFFDHTGEKDLLVIKDTKPDQPVPEAASLDFMGLSGLSHQSADHVMKLRRNQRMVTAKVALKDYNYMLPEMKIIGSGGKDGQGELSAHGDHLESIDEAKRVAKLRAELLVCEKERLDGEGVCRAFRPGHTFTLVDTASELFAGDYTLLKVQHHGDQREGFESDDAVPIYTTRFTCIPAATVYRPPLASPKPKIQGVITAKVEAPEGPYAYLDEEGRYKAKMPFDLVKSNDMGEATLPIRMAQPYGGPGYGMHFPVHNGNDMVLGFENGDVDRPIALGTMPNPSNASPVTSRNKSESVIKTASGHIWRMDDKEEATIVDLTTAGKHLFALDDAAGTKQVKIKTSGGHLFILDDTGKNATILTTGGHTVKIDDAANTITVETKGGHSLVMDDPGKKISLKDGQGVNAVELDGGGKVLSLSSTGDIKIDAGKNIIMTAKEAVSVDAGKDLSLHADGAGSFTADKTMIHEAKKDFTLKAKKIGITAETDYTVAGKKMDFKAENDFKVDASKINIKASGDVIIKGSKVAQN